MSPSVRRTDPARRTPAPVNQPKIGFVGWLRWAWRQLTSMRTALLLLLLLALGAVPGSLWPQRSLDASRTADYIDAHPRTGPWLDRLGFFDVYASPWFSAIYLLLFVSLVGCVLPRTAAHWRSMRAAPPRTPRRLTRLPAHAVIDLPDGVDADTALGAVEQQLRAGRAPGRRYRVRRDGAALSGESGYLRETGNLVFHLALVLVIVGVAIGHVFGWKGDVIVPVGQTFTNTQTRFDTLSPGPWVDTASDLRPFTVRVDSMDVTFEEEVTGRGQFGQPRDFTARVTVADEPGAPTRSDVVQVNHPLEMDRATVFLLGNGYAPVVTVRDAKGRVLSSGPTPMLPTDGNYRSVGAIKVPAAQPKDLGFVALFLPTVTIDEQRGPESVFPDAKAPALALSLYEGELFPGGKPSSVFAIDTDSMSPVISTSGRTKGSPTRIWLTPGQSATLPGDRGSITFDKVERFAGFSVRYDPDKWLTLGASLAALAGLVLSLTVPRRRMFARVEDGRLTIAGMSRDDDSGLGDLVTDVARRVRSSLDPASGRIPRS